MTAACRGGLPAPPCHPKCLFVWSVSIRAPSMLLPRSKAQEQRVRAMPSIKIQQIQPLNSNLGPTSQTTILVSSTLAAWARTHILAGKTKHKTKHFYITALNCLFLCVFFFWFFTSAKVCLFMSLSLPAPPTLTHKHTNTHHPNALACFHPPLSAPVAADDQRVRFIFDF